MPHDPGKKDAKAGEKERKDVKRIRDYRIEAGGKKYQLLRGEFHRHTEISWDGGADGSLEDMFRYAIDAAALDWIGNGDHDNGAGREYSWWLTQKFTDAYHVKDRFTPLFTYERSVSLSARPSQLHVRAARRPHPAAAGPAGPGQARGRHPRRRYQDALPLPEGVRRHLRRPHQRHRHGHRLARQRSRRSSRSSRSTRAIAMSYEKEEAPRAGYDPKSGKKPANIAGWYPKGYINHALDKGYRLGFESSSDHWSTHISFCVALAEKHDRAGILAALKQRHCYGATDNIILDVRSGDHLMGDEFKTKDAPVLKVHVVGTAPIQAIDVIKDGEVVETAAAGEGERVGVQGQMGGSQAASRRSLLLRPRAAEGRPTGLGFADVD